MQNEPWLIPLSPVSSGRKRVTAKKPCAPLSSLSELLKEPSVPSKRSELVPDHKRHTHTLHQVALARTDSDGSGDTGFQEFRKVIGTEGKNVEFRNAIGLKAKMSDDEI